MDNSNTSVGDPPGKPDGFLAKDAIDMALESQKGGVDKAQGLAG